MKSGYFVERLRWVLLKNNRRLHIVQKITKNLTTLHNLPNLIHKLQIKPYRENIKSNLWLMNLPFTSAVKNTTQTQSSTNWNLTLNRHRYFVPPLLNFAPTPMVRKLVSSTTIACIGSTFSQRLSLETKRSRIQPLDVSLDKIPQL